VIGFAGCDLSDAAFALVAPLLPARKPCGRKPTDPEARMRRDVDSVD
jgi:hypothetical protein